MCSVATMAQHNEQQRRLDKIAKLFPDIARWVAWWDARKYYLFPAFR